MPLISNLNNQYYTNANVLTNRPEYVQVLVEDELDVPFWHDALSQCCPNRKFRISPYSYTSTTETSPLSKGKAQILKESKNLGDRYIGCVDSDYDYLLETPEKAIMNPDRHILQTYTYSIENHLCQWDTLEKLCVKATKEYCDFDFEHYLTEFSKTIYPLLIWSLFCEKEGIDAFKRSQWDDIIPCDETVNKSTGTRVLRKLLNNVEKKIDELEIRLSGKLEDLCNFEEDLRSNYPLTPRNAYLFVRGHDLLKFVLSTLLKELCNQMRSQHYQNISCANATTSEQNNRKSQYRKYILDIEQLLSVNYEYKATSILYPKIRADIESIFPPTA
ncbi:DUF4435 domain-containing protein [Bacteroides fragilis]|uniref:DUF4435 domain-containing protein n=1 Tax=Bacteroides fragilis TaxID=817 RepID=UPI00202E489A|nr:DUF4435 domain-containing protein [Bacteroides fragilis]MCE8622371.1 DUF4435 domain-containing protein [Bacteroides fragilis]MCM0270414.1 DUF4435 domain-containing protein [Bacteroides fragilis]